MRGNAPTFGLWYDFRQKPPLGDYACFYAECLEEIEEGERLGFTDVHEDAGRAREIVAPAIAYQRTRYAEWGTDRGKPKPEPIRPENLPWERYLVGTPDEVAEGLVRLHEEAPYDHLCFWGRLPGVTHEEALANMRLFASEVAPRVREMVRA